MTTPASLSAWSRLLTFKRSWPFPRIHLLLFFLDISSSVYHVIPMQLSESSCNPAYSGALSMMYPEPLLEEILSQPQLDEPRRRCAEWLEQHCHPLGEFIRTQL